MQNSSCLPDSDTWTTSKIALAFGWIWLAARSCSLFALIKLLIHRHNGARRSKRKQRTRSAMPTYRAKIEARMLRKRSETKQGGNREQGRQCRPKKSRSTRYITVKQAIAFEPRHEHTLMWHQTQTLNKCKNKIQIACLDGTSTQVTA